MGTLSKVFEQLEEHFLTCVVCIERFVDPKSLDCLHTFCSKCANQMTKDGEVRCPVCNSTTLLTEAGLKTDFKAKSLLDFRRSFKRCLDTEKRRSRRQGAPVPQEIEREESAQSVDISLEVCPSHGQPFQFYCDNCEVLTCAHCVVSSGHQGHKCCTFLEGANFCRRKLETKLPSVTGRVKSIQESLSWLENQSQSVGRQGDSCAAKLKEAGEQAKAAIDRLVARRVEEVTTCVRETEAKLERSAQELREQLFDMSAYKAHAERYLACTETESSKLEQLVLALQLAYRLGMLSDLPLPVATSKHIAVDPDVRHISQTLEALISVDATPVNCQSNLTSYESLPYYWGFMEREEAGRHVRGINGGYLLRRNAHGALVITNQIGERDLHFMVNLPRPDASSEEVEEVLRIDDQLDLRVPIADQKYANTAHLHRNPIFQTSRDSATCPVSMGTGQPSHSQGSAPSSLGYAIAGDYGVSQSSYRTQPMSLPVSFAAAPRNPSTPARGPMTPTRSPRTPELSPSSQPQTNPWKPRKAEGGGLHAGDWPGDSLPSQGGLSPPFNHQSRAAAKTGAPPLPASPPQFPSSLVHPQKPLKSGKAHETSQLPPLPKKPPSHAGPPPNPTGPTYRHPRSVSESHDTGQEEYVVLTQHPRFRSQTSPPLADSTLVRQGVRSPRGPDTPRFSCPE